MRRGNFRHARRALAMLVASALLSSGCASQDKAGAPAGTQAPIPRAFPDDFQIPVSHESDEPIGGFGGDGGGVARTPVIFVHGNAGSAGYWQAARAFFKQQGWQGDELWAIDYGARAFESNDRSVPALERFITAVQGHLSQKTGRSIRQVDIVAHSVGVTLVRQWLLQNNAYHRVRTFVGIAGANHGMSTARPDARARKRITAFELFPGSPWLAQLNRVGETPGATRYMTLYDGTGRGDALFPEPHHDSPQLAGAYNVPYNVRYGQHYDHLELGQQREPLQDVVKFLRQSREPLPEATPPEIVRTSDDLLRTSQSDSRVHCETGEHYPTLKSAAALERPIEPGVTYTCFAHNAKTRLSSPLTRFKRDAAPPAPDAPALTLSATPVAGAYGRPQRVTLSASDPDATIVYTTSRAYPTLGSPRYLGPIYVPAPVTLQAIAVAPDGRTSPPIRVEYDIRPKEDR